MENLYPVTAQPPLWLRWDDNGVYAVLGALHEAFPCKGSHALNSGVVAFYLAGLRSAFIASDASRFFGVSAYQSPIRGAQNSYPFEDCGVLSVGLSVVDFCVAIYNAFLFQKSIGNRVLICNRLK